RVSWNFLNAAASVSFPFCTGAKAVFASASASVMNGGHCTIGALEAAAPNTWYGRDGPDTDTVKFLNDGESSRGLNVGNRSDGAVFVMFHESIVAFSQVANSVASFGCWLCLNTG